MGHHTFSSCCTQEDATIFEMINIDLTGSNPNNPQPTGLNVSEDGVPSIVTETGGRGKRRIPSVLYQRLGRDEEMSER